MYGFKFDFPTKDNYCESRFEQTFYDQTRASR
jgi:hypothetical protein